MDKQQTLLEACLRWKKDVEEYVSDHELPVDDDDALLILAIDREVERQKGDGLPEPPYKQPDRFGNCRECDKIHDHCDKHRLMSATYDLLAKQKETNRLLKKLLEKPCHIALGQGYPLPEDYMKYKPLKVGDWPPAPPITC